MISLKKIIVALVIFSTLLTPAALSAQSGFLAPGNTSVTPAPTLYNEDPNQLPTAIAQVQPYSPQNSFASLFLTMTNFTIKVWSIFEPTQAIFAYAVVSSLTAPLLTAY